MPKNVLKCSRFKVEIETIVHFKVDIQNVNCYAYSDILRE